MRWVKKIYQLIIKLRPRYQLSLDSHFYNFKKNKIVYRFKIFGEHVFPKFTFEEIKNNKQLIYDINPFDLMKITIDDYVDTQKKSMLKISEIIRDNKYKIYNSDTEEILSGDEICDNFLLIEKIKNIDLYKIVYNTAFNHGRQLSREIIKQSVKKDCNENIVTLKIIDGGKKRT